MEIKQQEKKKLNVDKIYHNVRKNENKTDRETEIKKMI